MIAMIANHRPLAAAPGYRRMSTESRSTQRLTATERADLWKPLHRTVPTVNEELELAGFQGSGHVAYVGDRGRLVRMHPKRLGSPSTHPLVVRELDHPEEPRHTQMVSTARR